MRPGSTAANRFPAYVDLVRRQLARDYPADALQGAGLSVMTGDVAVGAGLCRRRGDAHAEIAGEQAAPAAAGRRWW